MTTQHITVHGDRTEVIPVDLIAKIARCSFSDCRRVLQALDLVAQTSGADLAQLIQVDPSLTSAEVSDARYYATESAFEAVQDHVRHNPNLAELGDRLRVLRRGNHK